MAEKTVVSESSSSSGEEAVSARVAAADKRKTGNSTAGGSKGSKKLQQNSVRWKRWWLKNRDSYNEKRRLAAQEKSAKLRIAKKTEEKKEEEPSESEGTVTTASSKRLRRADDSSTLLTSDGDLVPPALSREVSFRSIEHLPPCISPLTHVVSRSVLTNEGCYLPRTIPQMNSFGQIPSPVAPMMSLGMMNNCSSLLQPLPMNAFPAMTQAVSAPYSFKMGSVMHPPMLFSSPMALSMATTPFMGASHMYSHPVPPLRHFKSS